MPVLHSTVASAQGIIDRLGSALEADPDSVWAIGDDLLISPGDFSKAAASAGKNSLEWLAAFGSDGCTAGPKRELIADTAWRTMSGTGHQHFLGFMRDLQSETKPEHLAKALFARWSYDDPRPSMRWDPNDYRPHALRADDPSTDPIRTVRGANWLAVQALPLFPTLPTLSGLKTTGFRSSRQGTFITYPVWTCPIDLSTARSLVAARCVQGPEHHRAVLRGMGVGQVFRAERFTDGKYRNFSPSRELL
jgi:hypothetical protein